MPARPEPSADWLSLGPASRLVGVDPDTLRRWADSGRVRSYATPGGHRRFARQDIARLQQRGRAPRRPMASLGATPERLTRAYSRSYRRAAATSAAAGVEDGDRSGFREDGRRLVELLLSYLDSSGPARRARIEAAAMASVSATAQRLAAAGAPTSTAIEAFIGARQPFLSELEALSHRRGAAADTVAAYAEATRILDRLLLRFVAELQQPVTEANR